jgi:hypothetical protein
MKLCLTSLGTLLVLVVLLGLSVPPTQAPSS